MNTKMNFSHANVSDKSVHDYQKGWQATFLKLDRALLR